MKVLDVTRKFLEENKAELKIGGGIGLMWFGGYTAVKAGMNHKDYLEDKKEKKGSELTQMETILLMAKLYSPSIGLGIVGTGLILSGNNDNINKYNSAMALVSTYSMIHNEYRDKVKEVIGEDKEKEVHKEAKKEVKEVHNHYGISDLQLYRESLTGQYFYMSPNELERIINEFNKEILYNDFTYFGELLHMLGLESGGFGENHGWRRGDIISVRKEPHVDMRGRSYINLDYFDDPMETYDNPC